jgi:hypothetical protein
MEKVGWKQVVGVLLAVLVVTAPVWGAYTLTHTVEASVTTDFATIKFDCGSPLSPKADPVTLNGPGQGGTVNPDNPVFGSGRVTKACDEKVNSAKVGAIVWIVLGLLSWIGVGYGVREWMRSKRPKEYPPSAVETPLP